jgi:hypothetical protein
VLFDLGDDPVEDFRCYLLPCREWFEKVREHEPKAENLDQFRAHGRIARVARQLVKNELPDEFATLQAVLSCQPFDVLNLPRTELVVTPMSRYDAFALASAASCSSLKSDIIASLYGWCP